MPATHRYKICSRCNSIMELGYINTASFYLCTSCNALEKYSYENIWFYGCMPGFDELVEDFIKKLEESYSR